MQDLYRATRFNIVNHIQHKICTVGWIKKIVIEDMEPEKSK